MITKETIAAVRAIPIPDYFKEMMPHMDVDAELKGIGYDLETGKHVSFCPFHQERTPSFRWFEHTNTCFCFGCGEGGDIITIHRKFRSVAFDDAIEFLYGHFYGEDVDIRKVKKMAISDQQVSKADMLVFQHTVLDRVSPKNFELAEDLSLLIRLGKLTGTQAVEYYQQRAIRS